MGRVQKGIKCSVINCDSTAVRSLSKNKISLTNLKVKEEKRLFLCELHYKEWKKGTKKDRELERMRFK